MIDEGRFVIEITIDRTYDDYLENRMLLLSVERSLGIVGEAAKQLRDIAPELANLLTRADNAIGLRNVLVHGYSRIENEIVWSVIHDHLPLLISEAEALLIHIGGRPPQP